MITKQVIKNLKPNQYILVEGIPCIVEKVSVSVAGKHGAAKARVECIGLFDGKRRSLIKPADEEVEVPIIQKKKAQVLSVSKDKAILMDLESYESFEVEIPKEFEDKIKEGSEVLYYDVLGQKTIKELR